VIKIPNLISSSRNRLFNLFPHLFWDPYSIHARESGLQEPLILLSFDSDTDEDADASISLFERLQNIGIPATFAVPGFQLERGAKAYKELFKRGAKFINHGGAAHTEWRTGRYWSVNFYSQKTSHEVREDIRAGHQIFQDVLGYTPSGFRAPHFGHFQTDDALALIHDELKQLGTYIFCSSSLAYRTRVNGPVIQFNGMLEIPIIGTYQWPTRIFDSYGHLLSMENRRVNAKYASKWFESVIDIHKRNIPALLNYYSDPSHVAENNAYFEAIEEAKDLGVRFVDFDDVIDLVKGQY
jgi:peptidoglycan/xylan/chitin deacetylase (PgdA/CDA1 family)